jgi:hypothetical protein
MEGFGVTRDTKREPVAIIQTWHKGGDQHAELVDFTEALAALPDGAHNLYSADTIAQLEQKLDMALRDAKGAHERWHLACNDYNEQKQRAEVAAATIERLEQEREAATDSQILGEVRKRFAQHDPLITDDTMREPVAWGCKARDGEIDDCVPAYVGRSDDYTEPLYSADTIVRLEQDENRAWDVAGNYLLRAEAAEAELKRIRERTLGGLLIRQRDEAVAERIAAEAERDKLRAELHDLRHVTLEVMKASEVKLREALREWATNPDGSMRYAPEGLIQRTQDLLFGGRDD